MRDLQDKSESFSGQLLVAQPSLHDPNFKKSVVLLSMHSAEDGAMGVILNRPSGKTLGEQNKELQFSPIADTPVYNGGPVGTDQFLLAAWRWPGDGNSFELYFGISQDKLQSLKTEHNDLEVRCFLGHSGWSPQQLEQELQQNAWLLSSMQVDLLQHHKEVELWKKIICEIEPDFKIEADAPEDPSANLIRVGNKKAPDSGLCEEKLSMALFATTKFLLELLNPACGINKTLLTSVGRV